MKKIIFFIIQVLFISTVYGQNENHITQNIQEGANLNEILSSYCYLFYDYQEATFLTNKGIGKALMNYNMLMDEMLYISHEGDTLILANPTDIRSIRFGKREFIYTSKGYMEILLEMNDFPALLIYRRVRLVDTKQYGPYGTVIGSGGIKNISVLSLEGNNSSLAVNKEAIFKVDSTYYLQKGKYLLQGATQANFHKIFGKEQKQRISNYIKEAKLNLKKKEDIIRLFDFCASNN